MVIVCYNRKLSCENKPSEAAAAATTTQRIREREPHHYSHIHSQTVLHIPDLFNFSGFP